MKMKMLCVIILTLFSQVLLFSQQKGTIIREFIDAPSLANSILGESLKQPIAVYLPPSYNYKPQKKFPVVYFLIGWSDTLGDYVRGNPDYIPEYVFENSMNSNVTQGRTKEMIMVIVNGYNMLQGCFYYNSPVTGNWEDFIVNDVVSHMDKTYRTIPSSNSRALLGTSMGGYASLTLSMRHPSVFSIGLGYCPGLADRNGLMKTLVFSDNNVIKKIISIQNKLAKYSRAEAHKIYLDTINYYIKHGDYTMMFPLSYASAFAANTRINAPYFDWPFSIDKNNNLVKDAAIFNKYEEGFGNLMKKIEVYKDSLLKLKGYAIDYGTNDGNLWIQEGSAYYDAQLTAAGIPHRLMKNNGAHGNLLKIRTENYQLPYCESLLSFNVPHLSNKASIEKFSIKDQLKEPVIDTINKTVTVLLKSTANIKRLLPTIYVSSGAKLFPFQNTESPYMDFSSNTVEYRVVSENGEYTSTWTVNASKSTSINNHFQDKNSLQIFPNPASNQVVLTANDNSIYKVEILDIMGKMALKKITNNQRVVIELNNIHPGSYIIKAYTNNACFIGTLMVQ